MRNGREVPVRGRWRKSACAIDAQLRNPSLSASSQASWKSRPCLLKVREGGPKGYPLAAPNEVEL